MKINDYQFLGNFFLDNIPTEHQQHRINTASTLFDQNSYGGTRKLRKYSGHPEGPVSVSVHFSLICGGNRFMRFSLAGRASSATNT